MQTAVACTRLISRAFLNGIYNRNASQTASGLPASRNENGHSENSGECGPKSTGNSSSNEARDKSLFQKPRIVSAISGIPKNISMRRLNPFQFGDDSCFVSHHCSGDALGKWICVLHDFLIKSFSGLVICQHKIFLPCHAAKIGIKRQNGIKWLKMAKNGIEWPKI